MVGIGILASRSLHQASDCRAFYVVGRVSSRFPFASFRPGVGGDVVSIRGGARAEATQSDGNLTGATPQNWESGDGACCESLAVNHFIRAS